MVCQSLIGTVPRKKEDGEDPAILNCQSLIGIVPHLYVDGVRVARNVSIPYRYSTTVEEPTNNEDKTECQSLIGTVPPRKTRTEILVVMVSIPYRYSTTWICSKEIKILTVSIPYRYSTTFKYQRYQICWN